VEDECDMLDAEKANRSCSKDASAAKKDVRVVQEKLALAKRRCNRFEDLTDDLENVEDHVFQAARDGDLDYLKFALEVGIPVNILDERGTSLLMHAVFCNRMSIVKMLMDRQADMSLQDANGATCLHYAAIMQRHHALLQFLDAGLGNIWLKDNGGFMAVDYARRPDQEKTMQLFTARLGGRPFVACVHTCVAPEEATGDPRTDATVKAAAKAGQFLVVCCDTMTYTPIRDRRPCCGCCR